MKNFKLLLATTAMLSAGAMNANADLTSNQVNLDMYVNFLKPITATVENYLGFGMVLADRGNKTVIVNPTSGFDTSSTATMISTATYTNYSTNQSGDTTVWHPSLNPAKIRYTGLAADRQFSVPAAPQMSNAFANSMLSLVFDYDDAEAHTVSLEDVDNGTPCGTVSNLNTVFAVDDDDVVANIGGTLTTADLREVQGSLICHGSTTVTLVVNEANMSSYTNQLAATHAASGGE